MRSIGWIALDRAGNPVRPTTTRYGRTSEMPPRVYQTERQAALMGKPTEVFVKEPWDPPYITTEKPPG